MTVILFNILSLQKLLINNIYFVMAIPCMFTKACLCVPVYVCLVNLIMPEWGMLETCYLTTEVNQ